MRRGVHRGAGLRLALRALLACGLAGAVAAAPARATDPAPAARPAEEPAPVPERPYGSSDLDRLRGASVGLDERGAATSEPDFGAETQDPGALRGRPKPLDALSHPPEGRAPEATGDGAGAARRGPPPLRLRQRPDVAAPAERTWAERLCDAERNVAFARREQRDAVRAYKRARRDEYPRGGARALIVEHRELATRRLARAEADRAALLAEAEAQDLDAESSACRRGL